MKLKDVQVLPVKIFVLVVKVKQRVQEVISGFMQMTMNNKKEG